MEKWPGRIGTIPIFWWHRFPMSNKNQWESPRPSTLKQCLEVFDNIHVVFVGEGFASLLNAQPLQGKDFVVGLKG